MQKLRRRERTLVASLCYKLVTAYNERVVACTALELEMLQYLFFCGSIRYRYNFHNN